MLLSSHKSQTQGEIIKTKRILTLSVFFTLLLNASASAGGLGSKKAAFQGGTTKEEYFPGIKDPVEGDMDFDNDTDLIFTYQLNKEEQNRIYKIPYDKIVDIEYGQKAGRRVGAAIATAILVSPIGLFLLFSKKRKHYITIGYKDAEDKEQVAVFELGKDLVRTALPILKTRTGKEIEYQDEEAKKSLKVT